MANKGPTLSGDQILTGDDYLLSANGLYAAYMQDDGNFVLYHGTTSNPGTLRICIREGLLLGWPTPLSNIWPVIVLL